MDTAMRSWELDNDMQIVDPEMDALYCYDPEQDKLQNSLRPWKADANHFKHVRISAVALVKMVMHARTGGPIEVMGLMQGYTHHDSIIVTDAFGLPVEGTETRVNAQEDANEYIVEYLRLSREAGGRVENVVGWYHSHPGYGCWLSGIDVNTQAMQQTFNDPFVAVVIDPDRTISAGRVDIGAFRTYPDDYPARLAAVSSTGAIAKEAVAAAAAAAAAAATVSGSSVPLAKSADFGRHADKYYALEVSHFKSTLDTSLLELLWHKYWVQTLSQSPLFTNREFSNKQIVDQACKLKEATSEMLRAQKSGTTPNPAQAQAADAAMEKLARESKAVVSKEVQGLIAGEVKASIFNGLGGVTEPTVR